MTLADLGTPRWRRELANAIRHPGDLLRFLDIDPAALGGAIAHDTGFPTLVPRRFAALMKPGDPHDPLLRQVLAVAAEQQSRTGFVADPVGDIAAKRAPGLLQKYNGRALLLVTGACAVHCRYCFRRHYPYADDGASSTRLNLALDALGQATDISEIILSGGDPLLLDDDALGALIERLDAIGHLRRLRLHTRIPVVLPSRVTPGLLRLLTQSRLRPVVVIHANQAGELGQDAARALTALGAAQIPLFNQSVLLRGINDNAQVLAALGERLFDLGVVNYYLHQLDRVAGSAHFEVSDSEALAVMDALREQLPGYLMPRLVREIPGEPSKTPLA